MTGDPTTGSPSSIRSAAARHEERAEQLRAQHTRFTRAANEIGSGEWTGAASTQFRLVSDSVAPSFARIADIIDNVAVTLRSHADSVEQIQDEAARIRSAEQSAENERERLETKQRSLAKTIASDDAVEADHVALRRTGDDLALLDGTDARLSSAWLELVSRRQHLDRSTADSLGDGSSIGLVSVSAATVAGGSDVDFLAWLGGLGPDQVAAMAGNEAVGDRLADMTDPDAVAAWWNGLGGDLGKGTSKHHSPAQDAFIGAFPNVVGNLNGVPFWARSVANVTTLKKEYKAASGEDRKAYRNILASLGKYDDVSLISLRPGHPPLAAVAIGNMDTAENVTYVVPGMSTTTKDTTLIERAALNLRDGQADWTGDTTALVAWINYDTPPVPSKSNGWDLSVLRGDDARAGAVRLQRDLAGFNATRGESKGILNVVGHSYGSTMTSLALNEKDLGVDNYVTVASAGVERQIHDAGDINADHVFAARAPRVVPGVKDGDGLSWIGQAGSMTRRDPAAPSFGATYLPTAGDPHDPVLNGVTTHDPLAHGPENPGYGYFDRNTESLANIAKATAGAFPGSE